MTRNGRARAVLAQHQRRLRKRYALIAAALAIPAMAGATDWGSATPHASGNTAVHRFGRINAANLLSADYLTQGGAGAIHSDADDTTTSFADQMTAAGPAAQAFRFTGTPLDKARAEQCLTMAIYYEAATQSDDGQRAVAQVVLNRVAHPSFPNTVCGVVFEGSERGTGCQFTFACDGSLARKPMAFWWDRADKVAREALAGAVYAPVGLATHYHTVDVHPYWDSSMQLVTTIGAHEFFRWPGAAGQPAAFRMAYFGGEPMAAPHPKALAPAPADNEDPIQLARDFEASHPTPTVALSAAISARSASAPAAPPPEYSEAVAARGGDALFRSSNLPSSGDLSPELQRSGQWLDRP